MYYERLIFSSDMVVNPFRIERITVFYWFLCEVRLNTRLMENFH